MNRQTFSETMKSASPVSIALEPRSTYQKKTRRNRKIPAQNRDELKPVSTDPISRLRSALLKKRANLFTIYPRLASTIARNYYARTKSEQKTPMQTPLKISSHRAIRLNARLSYFRAKLRLCLTPHRPTKPPYSFSIRSII